MLAPQSQADSPSTRRWKGAENTAIGHHGTGARKRQRYGEPEAGMTWAVSLANIARSSPIGE
jgi:hypothetical protein